MARMRLEPNLPGIRAAAWASPGVRAAVADKAEKIAAATRSKTENEVIVVNAGRRRARSYVRMLGPDAAAEEAMRRPLGSSLGAS